MKMGYIVTIQEITDGVMQFTFCKTLQDVGNLVTHLDEEKYEIMHITQMTELIDASEFIKKNTNLETGGETK